MSNAEAVFWRETQRYHDLAERVEENVEVTHPPYVTGRSVGCEFCYACFWHATAVTYYERRP